MADIDGDSTVNHVPVCEISIVILPFISLLIRDIMNVVHGLPGAG
jgi:hypothetical protein